VGYLTFKPSALHTQAANEGNMLFATPRSWVRVSDILKFDSDISKAVIRHKIIGNVGESEGAQFIEYCKKHRDVVTADEFISGQAEAPQTPEELSILVGSIVNKVSFISTIQSPEALTATQKETIETVIRALFRIPQAEYTIIGLKSLIELNRQVVKKVYMQMDDNRILAFIKKNKYALGLDDADYSNRKNKWLAMWE
jgi:hypothetical protein